MKGPTHVCMGRGENYLVTCNHDSFFTMGRYCSGVEIFRTKHNCFNFMPYPAWRHDTVYPDRNGKDAQLNLGLVYNLTLI